MHGSFAALRMTGRGSRAPFGPLSRGTLLPVFTPGQTALFWALCSRLMLPRKSVGFWPFAPGSNRCEAAPKYWFLLRQTSSTHWRGYMTSLPSPGPLTYASFVQREDRGGPQLWCGFFARQRVTIRGAEGGVRLQELLKSRGRATAPFFADQPQRILTLHEIGDGLRPFDGDFGPL